MTITTKRLVLRPWREEDADDLFKYARDPDVGPSTGWLPHASAEASLWTIQNILSAPETYAVCLKEDGKPVGSIGLMFGEQSNIGLPEDEGEVGYWIGKPFWGQGLIPEATAALLRHGFLDLGLTTIWCAYFDGNEKSRRVAEKCGFVYHHTNPSVYWKLLDKTITEHVTVLTREKWLADENARLLSFWNDCFASYEPEPFKGGLITDPAFWSAIDGCIPPEGAILDYGCGSGWMLMELALADPSLSGVGVDCSENAVSYAEKSAALSGLSRLRFICGDESALAAYPAAFDFVVTVNTLDVLPEARAKAVLAALHRALRPGGILAVCLNPRFTDAELTDLLGMEQRGDYCYKDGILRWHRMEDAGWQALFAPEFRVLGYHTFAVTEAEKAHPRRMYLLKAL